VLVEYAPGGTSPAHLHPKSAFIYATVLEGAIRLITGLSVHAPAQRAGAQRLRAAALCGADRATQNIEHDAEVVALGTLLHDITLNKHFVGPRRFVLVRHRMIVVKVGTRLELRL